MVGGDVVVAYYDAKTATFHADDYYMSATAQVSLAVSHAYSSCIAWS